MADDIYDVPRNSLKAKEEEAREESKSSDHHAITPRKRGIGSFFRQLASKDDMESVTNIFANAMINAVSDTIDEVTGNLTHRAKTVLWGTEDYNRGRSRSSGGDRYNSYSKYYEERNGRSNNRPTGSSSRSRNNDREESDVPKKKWKYNDVLFDKRIFGKAGAELAAWRVIKGMDEIISNPEVECVSVADFFRLCKEEDDQNEMLSPEFTDENWGWDSEEVISNLKPIAVPSGYIIELPKPKYLR